MSSVCPGHGTLSGPVRVVPNSALRRVILQGEQVVEAALDGVLLGEYAPGTGPSPLALVEEEGRFDPGKAGKQRSHGEVHPRPVRLAHHEPGDREREYAVEDVNTDLALGEVEHRREGDDLRVLHLAKVALNDLLGAVVGDDLRGRGPGGGLVAEEDPLAEQLLLEHGAGLRARAHAEAQPGRLVAGERGRDHARDPARGEDGGDLGLHLLLRLAGLSPGEAVADHGELAVHLSERLVEAAGLLLVQARGVADDEAALGTEDGLSRLERGEPGEGLLADDLVAVLSGGEQLWVVGGRQRADEAE